MNRYVRRGAKGIALLDESSGFPRLYCIFDVSDTGVVPLAAAMQKGANMNTNSRNVTYSTVWDYQLPNLTLNQPRKPLGKYGQAAPDVPDEPSFGAVQHDAPEREPVPTPDGSEADGRECIHRSGERKALRFCHFEDEIDRMLRTGSNFEGGKIRIYALYQQQGDAKERAASETAYCSC